MNIPIVLICFNNFKYIDNMIKQLENLYTSPNIIIIDNNSSCNYTQSYLASIKKYTVLKQNTNHGDLVWQRPEIFNTFPDKFILSDPYLEFNKNTPTNFLDIMVKISDEYKSKKVGFALDISEPEKIFPYKFSDFGHNGISTICETQKQYWSNRIEHNDYEMYFSEIDTTFCLYNKTYNGQHIRMAGDFTMKHLPWYIENDGISRFSRYLMYKDAPSASSIKCFEMKYIADNNIIPIQKRNETFLIQFGDEGNDHFWKYTYSNWENETFDIFDKYLDPNKQFLDIGAWIGTTCLYASKKSSYVVCVEADPISVEKLKTNILLNYFDVKVDVENSAIYNKTTKILFGPNSSNSTSNFNDSMSQIKLIQTKENDILTNTITFQDLISKYKLYNLSLIKIDIEGGEEFILEEILEYVNINKIPAYLSFHYSWWNDKNLDRFSNLNESHKNEIRNNPFCSILFL
jgi:FkbM family methyltransferase